MSKKRLNIRCVFWGDNPKQVSETEKWEKSADLFIPEGTPEWCLVFKGQIYEHDFYLSYYFQKNNDHAPANEENLFLVRMEFLSERMPKSEVNDLFHNLEKNTLEEKYGTVAYKKNLGTSRMDEPNGQKITRRVIHDSEECIEGKTVIELSAIPKSDYEDGLWKIKVVMWENGNGGTAEGGRYQEIEIDKGKKHGWLKKQALREF